VSKEFDDNEGFKCKIIWYYRGKRISKVQLLRLFHNLDLKSYIRKAKEIIYKNPMAQVHFFDGTLIATHVALENEWLYFDNQSWTELRLTETQVIKALGKKAVKKNPEKWMKKLGYSGVDDNLIMEVGERKLNKAKNKLREFYKEFPDSWELKQISVDPQIWAIMYTERYHGVNC
jgi:hypothetical protein